MVGEYEVFVVIIPSQRVKKISTARTTINVKQTAVGCDTLEIPGTVVRDRKPDRTSWNRTSELTDAVRRTESYTEFASRCIRITFNLIIMNNIKR